ncbi:hypothetical protein [Noviherbaspirillum cavernae]|nr:hypothetical protein [Noviherbaspirillum cavernae]
MVKHFTHGWGMRAFVPVLLGLLLAACGGGGGSSSASGQPSSSSSTASTSGETGGTSPDSPGTGGSTSTGTTNPDTSTPTRAATARFSSPTGITSDSKGNLYVTDTGNYTIRKIAPDMKVSTIAGAVGVAGTTDGPIESARFTNLQSITATADGTLYFVDGNAIRKLSTEGLVTTVAGDVNEEGNTSGPGSNARFREIANIAIDSDGSLYVADRGNSAIKRIDRNGNVSIFYQEKGLVNEPNGLSSSGGLAIDSAGDLIVGDFYGIHRLSRSGIPTLIAGGIRKDGALISVDGIGSNASFIPLLNITVANDGTIFAIESTVNGGRSGGTHSVVRRITTDGTVKTIAGKPYDLNHEGSADGIGQEADFFLPRGITASVDGNVYVVDTANGTIRRVTHDGKVTTIAGAPRQIESSD